MHSVWNSVLPWVLLCLFSSVRTADNSVKIIISEEKKAEKLEGSCVTIQCKYQHQDGMQLLWIKDPEWNETLKRFNGTVVYSNTEERRHLPEYSDRVKFITDKNHWTECTLKINDLKKNDTGKYAFRVISNDLKYKSEEFELTVKDNPCKVHIKPPYLKSFKDGDKVSFSCATSDTCKLYPEWLLSDRGFQTEKKENEEKYNKVTLTVSWKDDGRILTCYAPEYRDDCLEKKVTLRVEYAPRETSLSDSSSPMDVKEGGHVTISCSSKANPKPNFTWLKNDNFIYQHGETLTLHNITSEKGDRFYCQAENIHGKENSRDININVIYVPKGVHVSSESTELKEREKLTLTCLVKSSNPEVGQYSYKWYKNEHEIYGQAMNTFTVASVRQSDNGRYRCQAENSVGETKSTNTAHVIVKYAPQNTRIDGTHQLKLGLTLQLECFTDAYPVANNYSWYFKPEHKHQFLCLSNTDKEYRIEKVGVGNAGWYKCSAENAIGFGKNSTELHVLVSYPPTKPNLTMKEVVKEAESYTITCTVESSPQAELTLTRSFLTNAEKQEIELKKVKNNYLSFTASASDADAGLHTCKAHNTEGENYSENTLTVWHAPKNVKTSARPGKVLKKGSTLILTCEAVSVPPVSEYTWTKSSVAVGHGQTLTFHFLNSSDSASYHCIATNKMGTARSSPINITVKYRPIITILHNMTTLGLWQKEVPVHLSCSVQCYPPATGLEWYKSEENTTVLSRDQNYTVQPHNSGTYYCRVKNDMGESISGPIEIYLNSFINKRLVQVIICLLIIIFLIVALILLQRLVLRKRSSGKNEAPQQPFFSVAPLWPSFNLRTPGSHNNTTETLVIEETTEVSGFRDRHSATAVYQVPPANRNKQAGRPNSNIHTVYNVVTFQPSMPHHTEEDATMSTVNYAMLQFTDRNNPNKSVPSCDSHGPVYAEVSKKKQMRKEQQSGHEHYENVSGMCEPKRQFPNINWDSDSSESEEEVLNYTKVSFTATSQHNPQKAMFFSDEDKTEYSEVKI